MVKQKKMIKRAPQHQIDTKAVRQILSILDENWLIRNQDERDYGIDLTIERFNGENATGDFILVQVKGTESQFEENIKLPKFPTKTILYSQLFNIPFFVFYTSNSSNETKFLWLQKYAELKLPRTTPKWDSQETVTLHFPQENDLLNNQEKIINIIKKEKSLKTEVKYLSLFESLKFHSYNVRLGEFGAGGGCYIICYQLSEYKEFIEQYSLSTNEYDEVDLLTLGELFRDIDENAKMTDQDRNYIDRQIGLLEKVKKFFLLDDELADFGVEMNAFDPY